MFQGLQFQSIVCKYEANVASGTKPYVFRNPSESDITIKRVSFGVNADSTVVAFQIENWGTDGTAAEGTITTSASLFSDGTFDAQEAKSGTAMSSPYVEEGEYVVLNMTAGTAAKPWVQVDYVLGRG